MFSLLKVPKYTHVHKSLADENLKKLPSCGNLLLNNLEPLFSLSDHDVLVYTKLERLSYCVMILKARSANLNPTNVLFMHA